MHQQWPSPASIMPQPVSAVLSSYNHAVVPTYIHYLVCYNIHLSDDPF